MSKKSTKKKASGRNTPRGRRRRQIRIDDRNWGREVQDEEAADPIEDIVARSGLEVAKEVAMRRAGDAAREYRMMRRDHLLDWLDISREAATTYDVLRRSEYTLHDYYHWAREELGLTGIFASRLHIIAAEYEGFIQHDFAHLFDFEGLIRMCAVDLVRHDNDNFANWSEQRVARYDRMMETRNFYRDYVRQENKAILWSAFRWVFYKDRGYAPFGGGNMDREAQERVAREQGVTRTTTVRGMRFSAYDPTGTKRNATMRRAALDAINLLFPEDAS